MKNIQTIIEALIYEAVEKAVQKVVPGCLESLIAIAEERKQSVSMNAIVQTGDRWLSAREACDILGVSRTTLWKYQKK